MLLKLDPCRNSQYWCLRLCCSIASADGFLCLFICDSFDCLFGSQSAISWWLHGVKFAIRWSLFVMINWKKSQIKSESSQNLTDLKQKFHWKCWLSCCRTKILLQYDVARSLCFSIRIFQQNATTWFKSGAAKRYITLTGAGWLC